jgi:hypothetical protein
MVGILNEVVSDYYCNVRRFDRGGVEMLTKAVRPMQQSSLAEWRDAGCPARGRALTDDEAEAKQRENWNRAVRRAKQSIRLLCQQMEADRLFTLTYRENVEDREKVKRDFQEFLRLVRKGGYQYHDAAGVVHRAYPVKDWKYVAVLEKQERGAYHVHVAVKGFQRVSMLRAAWYRALGGSGLDRGSDTPGAVNVTSPRQYGKNRREWKTSQLASYIVKYLHKTFDELQAEKRRYWSSRNLKKPSVERIWLCATNFVDAIKETYAYAKGVYGVIDRDVLLWCSQDNTNFWLSGKTDEYIATGCPF